MSLPEKIIQHLQKLPESVQAEVLDFVEYLESKVGRHQNIQYERTWSTLSLSNAMRDMEDDQTPYSSDDLKEVFS
jgi:Mg/Co/Ni transporter MgtE